MVHAADKEQIEMLKKWWGNYGRILLLAVVAGLILGFGWNYWQHYKIKHRSQASLTYVSLLQFQESNNSAEMVKVVNQLKHDFKDTPYAALGSLLSAKQAVEENKLDDALAQLQWVIANSQVKSFQAIAQLRAARILLAQQQYEQALAMLKPLRDKSFAPMVLSITGDIYAAQGNKAQAQQAYQQANQAYQDIGVQDPLLTMKLNQL